MDTPFTTKQHKILIIAEAANPTWTSVPLVGWSLANALRGVADVHLVTQVRNRQAILDYGYEEKKDFTAIDSEPVMRPLWLLSSKIRGGKGVGWTTASVFNTLGYYYFEHLVWKTFREELRRGVYDIVHRITPLSPTTPSLLAGKCKKNGIPFILGPLNGGVPWPKHFDSARRQEKEWLSYVRSAYKLLPGYHSTLKSSAAILTGSQYTLSQIPEKFHNKCIYLPENAVDPKKFTPNKKLQKKQRNGVVNICFAGRLVPYKGPDMLIEAALPLLQSRKLNIDIIGDGPLMPALKELVQINSVENQVCLWGWVEHASLHSIMQRSTVFAFPSIREFGGGVVLEAMALGLVPIVVDYAGPGELVDKKVGLKVPIGSRESIVSKFRIILNKIINNEYDLEKLSESSVQRVRRLYTWNAKAQQVAMVYQWILKGTKEKPAFFNMM